jgi:hypothetical protein
MSTQITEITDSQIARESAAFEMLQRQAKMFASSSLVPKEFQGNIANCAIGIGIAKRLGADPFMVLQNVDIIHGRPSFRATFLIAMVNSSGRFEPLQYRMDGIEGAADRSCIAWAKSKDDGTVLEGPKITIQMAKAEGWSTKSGSKWITMPELMLRYRAAAFFARLYAPDITLGMMTAEEAHDAVERDVTPSAARSKLFTDIPNPPVYKKLVTDSQPTEENGASPQPELSQVAVPQNEAPSLFQEAEVSALDAVKAWLNKSGVKWTNIDDKLYAQSVTNELRNNPDDCTDDELRDVLAMRSQLEAVKGGKK